MTAIDCIITAAGLSSRMGKWKMMLPWGAGTVLDASIKNALQFCSRVILVSGFRARELQQRYDKLSEVHLVHNPDFAKGLMTSITAAIPWVQTDYCFISHGDLPCLNKEIFSKIWKLRGNYAILPSVDGTPGHPILLSRPCLLQAMEYRHYHSMRQALLAGKYHIAEMHEEEMIRDIDTPQDYQRAWQLYQEGI